MRDCDWKWWALYWIFCAHCAGSRRMVAVLEEGDASNRIIQIICNFSRRVLGASAVLCICNSICEMASIGKRVEGCEQSGCSCRVCIAVYNDYRQRHCTAQALIEKSIMRNIQSVLAAITTVTHPVQHRRVYYFSYSLHYCILFYEWI